MPARKATGTNTAISASDVATMGADTSFMAATVASFGCRPPSIFAVTASTTTIASSTTMPIASTRPSRDSVLMEKPNSGKNAKVPTRDTGTASDGISVARKFCRKMKTTRITSATAWNSVTMISLMPASMASVVSREISYSRSLGKSLAISIISALIFFASSRPLASGNW